MYNGESIQIVSVGCHNINDNQRQQDHENSIKGVKDIRLIQKIESFSIPHTSNTNISVIEIIWVKVIIQILMMKIEHKL